MRRAHRPPTARRGTEAAEEAARRWHKLVGQLRTWHRAGQRAVHKPLFTLMLLARAAHGSSRVRFAEIEAPLAQLLQEFGPPRASVHPDYPFWHLQSDGFWEVEDAKTFPLRRAGHSPPVTELHARDATGHVPDALWHALRTDPALREHLVSRILNEFWPPTLHDAIRGAIGLPEEGAASPSTPARRSREFRDHVLRVYEYRCAVCAYDGQLGSLALGIDAAHVRWHSEGGPDTEDNGIALCTFHHHAFDRGALGLSEDRRILVSEHVRGGPQVEGWLLRFVGARLQRPQAGHPEPAGAHIAWHRNLVFRGPPRQFARARAT